MAEPFIIAENLSYTYRDGEGGGTAALRGVSFRIDRGEYVAVLGHNGSGKSTLAKLMNGILIPTGGRLTVCGTEMREGMSDDEIFGVRRRVGMVFQNPDNQLVATIVEEDVAFGPENLGVPREEIRRRVDDALRTVGMYEYKDSQPHRLSGGQKQRVAIARALVDRPQVLLLDEPLAALDLKLRQHMLLELDTIHDQVGITFLYVTHDQGEAMSLSDRIAVINKGKIEQLAGPAQIYEAPASRFVASFIGDTNFFHGEIVSVDGDYCFIQVEGFPQIKAYNDRRLSVGQEIDLSVRPEKIRVTLTPPPPEKGASINVFPSKVKDIVYQGVYTKFWVTSSGLQIQSLKPHSRFLLDQEPITWNDEVFVWWHPDDGYMVAAEN